jgi:hypothetical protein
MPALRSAKRLPSDPGARDRLRAAQLVESEAVTAALQARTEYEAAITRRDRVLAKEDSAVAAAELACDVAHAGVVTVSGLARSAALLGTTTAELGRAVKTAKGLTALSVNEIPAPLKISSARSDS